MPNKMLIDATHPEETRVVVVRGNRVEEFDFESAQRKQLRGNIYLAKVTRVEPSLQAAFIEYGGNRHGFLAFSEIHPDYYQIPVADRQALIEADERAHREAEEESENRSSRRRSRHRNSRRRGHGDRVRSAVIEDANQEAQPHHAHDGDDHSHDDHADGDYSHSHAHDADHHDADPDHHHDGDHEHTHAHDHGAEVHEHTGAHDHADHDHTGHDDAQDHDVTETVSFSSPSEAAVAEAIAIPEVAEPETVSDPEHVGEVHDEHVSDHTAAYAGEAADATRADSGEPLASTEDDHHAEGEDEDDSGEDAEEEEQVESVGGDDALEEVPERAYRPRRQYKIQEVIKRRQVMLVQVVKEERGNKGAALTTYLSLAGRYAVLMPNTARGGGISRKITSAQDRSRLKEVVQDLDVPEGMGIILRTAGASRTKPEIKRDFEYLIRMWETVRDMTLRSQAPTLVYEEGSLIKLSLRDLYNKEIDEIQVAGEAGYREARDFMKMLMPSNVRAV
ncbi:MAG: ribonuclease E/G, partial [Nitrobacter sp.]